MTNLDRKSSAGSSVRVGRWAMSMATPFRDARYMTVATSCGGHLCRRPPGRAHTGWPGKFLLPLLRVQLHNELLLDLRINLGPGRKRVHEDPHPVGDDLQPGRDLPLPGLRAGDHERGQFQ